MTNKSPSSPFVSPPPPSYPLPHPSSPFSLLTLLPFHPALGFVKLNFDRASKGNPRHVSYGGVFKDVDGNILRIFSDYLGFKSNNAADISALIQGQ
jgi:hypothetical protein